jgi:uncharacterized protein YggU (UPF0235/DUF167 family)
MAASVPFAATRGGVRLAVRLTPKGAPDRIVGLIEDGHGGWALKAAVAAAPVDGKANAALITLLARHFGLKQRDLAVISGSTGRSKIIELVGDPATLTPILTAGLRPWLTRD